MAKSSLAGADGALTWVVSAARAGALFVGRGRGGRGLRARRGAARRAPCRAAGRA